MRLFVVLLSVRVTIWLVTAINVFSGSGIQAYSPIPLRSMS